MNMVLTESRTLDQEAVTLLPVMQMDRMEPMQACTVMGGSTQFVSPHGVTLCVCLWEYVCLYVCEDLKLRNEKIEN